MLSPSCDFTVKWKESEKVRRRRRRSKKYQEEDSDAKLADYWREGAFSVQLAIMPLLAGTHPPLTPPHSPTVPGVCPMWLKVHAHSRTQRGCWRGGGRCFCQDTGWGSSKGNREVTSSLPLMSWLMAINWEWPWLSRPIVCLCLLE